jgi:hypothetical protein
VWLLARGSDRLVLPAVMAGALIKVPILAISPVLALVVFRRSWATAAEGLLLAFALAAACYLPFWHGLETLTALGRTSQDLFTASPASVVRYVMRPALGDDLAATLARAFAYVSFLVVFVLVLRRAWRARDARTAVSLAYATLMAALLLAVTWFQAWYVVWPFGLAAALACPARHREVALLALGGLLQYFVFIYLWVMGVIPDEPIRVQSAAYAALIAPLALGTLTALARSRWLLHTPRRQRLRRDRGGRGMFGLWPPPRDRRHPGGC